MFMEDCKGDTEEGNPSKTLSTLLGINAEVKPNIIDLFCIASSHIEVKDHCCKTETEIY